MRRISILTICIIFLVFGVASAKEKGHSAKGHTAKGHSSGTHWEYSGKAGPENWGKLDKAFAACSEGKNQSPVNITGFIKADLKNIEFNYNSKPSEILNNGHTIQVNFESGSTIMIDNIIFELKQFHFHAPSENVVDGKSYPLEAHLVHADKQGNLAVIGIMFTEGAENELINALWKQIPKKAGDKVVITEKLSVNNMLPVARDYFRFNGSLTTPPCTEGVRWLVLKNAMTISKEQVKVFTEVMQHNNNRPVQPINARTILK
jgi:carbonic anhydrase